MATEKLAVAAVVDSGAGAPPEQDAVAGAPVDKFQVIVDRIKARLEGGPKAVSTPAAVSEFILKELVPAMLELREETASGLEFLDGRINETGEEVDERLDDLEESVEDLESEGIEALEEQVEELEGQVEAADVLLESGRELVLLLSKVVDYAYRQAGFLLPTGDFAEGTPEEAQLAFAEAGQKILGWNGVLQEYADEYMVDDDEDEDEDEDEDDEDEDEDEDELEAEDGDTDEDDEDEAGEEGGAA